MVFYVQDLCDERWSVVLHGKTIGVNSFVHTMTPNIIGEEEADDVHANRNDHDEGELINIFFFIMAMATPPASPPPPPPPPPAIASTSPYTLKRTRKATQLRSLATRPPGAERPVVHIDPAIGKADGPHKKKLRTYLGIVARDKVDVTYETWKEVPATQKGLIWEDIQAEFDIPKASDGRTKKKVLQTISERWRQFKFGLTRKWALAADKDSVDDTVREKYNISKEKLAQFCQTLRDPSWEDVWKKAQAIQKQNTAPHKLMAEKTKKNLEEAAQSRSTEGVIDPPSPIRRHVKWKMARTKKIGQMTSEAAKEIAEKIVSVTGFVYPPWTSGCPDCCHWATRTPWPCVCCWSRCDHKAILWIGSTNLPQFFLDGSRRTRAADLTNQGPTGGVDHRKSDLATDVILKPDAMQSQGLAMPPKPEVGPLTTRVSTKESCVDPSGNDPETGDSDKYGLYIEENPSHLVALGRVYEGSTKVHNIPLLHGQVKVMWDATVFGVFNQDFSLYIKHEDLSEIAHGGQCLSISVIQLHLTETSMRAGNSDVYGFLEPQSIQRFRQSQFE
ncbi:hypothetical protein HKD37_15G043400 [Glycine soja]